jgi:hypothetical protein
LKLRHSFLQLHSIALPSDLKLAIDCGSEVAGRVAFCAARDISFINREMSQKCRLGVSHNEIARNGFASRTIPL